MNLDPIAILSQTALLLVLAPLITGCIRNWKARLQNRRGPRVWQPYFDLLKFLRKDMVISEHASWVFCARAVCRVHHRAAGGTDGADGEQRRRR